MGPQWVWIPLLAAELDAPPSPTWISRNYKHCRTWENPAIVNTWAEIHDDTLICIHIANTQTLFDLSIGWSAWNPNWYMVAYASVLFKYLNAQNSRWRTHEFWREYQDEKAQQRLLLWSIVNHIIKTVSQNVYLQTFRVGKIKKKNFLKKVTFVHQGCKNTVQ